MSAGNRYYERKVEDSEPAPPTLDARPLEPAKLIRPSLPRAVDRLKRTVEYNQDDFRHWDVTETTNGLPSQSASVPRQSRDRTGVTRTIRAR